jgi:hypothetical protein
MPVYETLAGGVRKWLNATYATLSGTETLTNKSVTAPAINGYTEGSVTANSGSAYTISIAAATIVLLTVNAASVTLTFPAAAAGKSFILSLRWSTAGSVTWPSAVKWASGTAPTLTRSTGKADTFGFWSDGTNWYGSVMGQNFTV